MRSRVAHRNRTPDVPHLRVVETEPREPRRNAPDADRFPNMGTNAFAGASVINLFHDNHAMPDAGDVCAPLRGKYESVDDPEVVSFLRDNPTVIDTLLKAHPYIGAVFDVPVTATLDASSLAEDGIMLVCVRGYDVEPAEAVRRFRSGFDDAWDAVGDQNEGIVLFTVR